MGTVLFLLHSNSAYGNTGNLSDAPKPFGNLPRRLDYPVFRKKVQK